MDFRSFLNEYLLIEYSPNHQPIYCFISNVEDDQLFLIVSQDFEKTGLLLNDTVECKIYIEQIEYSFSAKITNMGKAVVGLNLVIEPFGNIEEFYNLRSERRVFYKFIAFTENNILASVKNISASGALVTTTAKYAKNDIIELKLVLEYPNVECTFTGLVIRVIGQSNGKTDYGIRIIKFSDESELKKYNEFLNIVTEKVLPL